SRPGIKPLTNCCTCCRMEHCTWSVMTIKPKRATRQWCVCRNLSCKKSIGMHFHDEYAANIASENGAGKIYRRLRLCFQRPVARHSHTGQHEGAYLSRHP